MTNLAPEVRANRAARMASVLLASAAVVACGGGSSGSGTGTAPPPAANGKLTVGWAANTESDLAGYKVYYGTTPGSYLQPKGSGLDAGPATELAVTGLQPGTVYYVVVTSYDKSGNESGYSAQVSGAAK